MMYRFKKLGFTTGWLLLGLLMIFGTGADTGFAVTQWIYGIHDADPVPTEFLNRAQAMGKTVWITATVGIGHNPSDPGGANFTQFSNAGHTVICRLNNGYGSDGTIPVPSEYANFAQRCANFVQNTQGCDYFIIGNETNLSSEWPAVNGYRSYVSPALYEDCFRLCYNAIKAVRPSAQVLCQALAPFAGPYPAGSDYDGNPLGWTTYMNQMLTAINASGGIDGIAVHINSRGYQYSDVHSTQQVNGQYFSFYVYKDWVNLGTPSALRTKPYYATECNGIYYWKGGHPECSSCSNASCCYQNDWIRWIYDEINAWNASHASTGQGIYRCVNMYRWCSWCDGWNIDGAAQKSNILTDYDEAYALNYTWPSGGSSPTATPTPPSGTLLSQGKPVTTDSNYDGTLTGAKAVDGVIAGSSNRWVSGSAADSHHWFYIDLQAGYNLSSFELYSAEANGEDIVYNIKTFTVRGSNTGSGAVNTWTTLASYNGATNDYPGTGVNAKVTLTISGSYRYVGVDITCSDGVCGTHARVQEAKVFGNTAPTPTPTRTPTRTPTPTATRTPTKTPTPVSGLISEGKPVTTDSNYDGTLTGAKAVDGVIGLSNRWVSGSAADSHHWIYVDLQSNYTLNNFELYSAEATGEDIIFNIKTFTVRGSTTGSGAVNTWTLLGSYNGATNDYPGTGANAKVTIALAGTYRYVGVDITCSDGACGTHARVAELKVFGTTPAGPYGSEDFNSLPTWASSFDAAWGGAATWSSVAGGQSGNALQATRSNDGSSAKVQVFTVPASTNVAVSGYMKCGSGTGYWAEFAYKIGNYSAQDFDQNGTTWTMIKKFDNAGTNGNGSVWTQYTSAPVNTGANTQISVGYKLGRNAGTAPTVLWDTIRVQ